MSTANKKRINPYDAMLKGIVTDTSDPKGFDRVQVYIPSMHGKFDQSKVGAGDKKYPWAQTMVDKSAGKASARLSVDDIIWVTFEDGDVNLPIYAGFIGAASSQQEMEDYQKAQYTKYKNRSGGGGMSSGSVYIYNGKSLSSIATSVLYANASASAISNKSTGGFNSHICIGKNNWSGNSAKDIIKMIQAYNPKLISDIESKYGISLNLDKDWSNLELSETSTFYKALSEVISSDESKKVQDTYIEQQLGEYVELGRTYGIKDPKALVYFCDLANSNIEEAKKIARESEYIINKMRNQRIDYDALAILNNVTIGGNYMLGSTINENSKRRNEIYSAVSQLDATGAFISGQTNHVTNIFKIYYPVDKKYKITTDFGYYIRNRQLQDYEYIYHDCVNITGSDICSQPVYAGFDATRVEIGYSDEYGTYVELYNDNYMIRYANLYSFSVTTGTSVRYGDIVGYVGLSGDTSGMCLSVYLYDLNKNTYIDPKPYFTYELPERD